MFDRPNLEHAPVSDPVAPRRKVSRGGLVLIKSLEGFQPRAWCRPDGRWALGYGHTRSAREGLTVSEADAELLLQYDLLPIIAVLNDRVSRPLNQHQFDALASFAVSIGVESFVTSEVLAALNAEGPEGAARALAASADIDPALARAGRRRHAEWALFGTDPDTPVTVATLLSSAAPEAVAPVIVETTPPAETPPAEAAGAEQPAAIPAADAAAATPDAVVPDAEAASDVAAVPAPAARPESAESLVPEVLFRPIAEETPAAPIADEAPATPQASPTLPAFSLRYAAAVSHLLGEPAGRAAPRLVEPTNVAPTPGAQLAAVAARAAPPEPTVEVSPALDPPSPGPETPTTEPVTPSLATEAPVAEAPVAEAPVAESSGAESSGAQSPESDTGPEPALAVAAVDPSPPAAPEVDRQAILAELMRRQMSPFAVQVGGPLPQLARPAAPVAPPPPAQPAEKLRPPVAASGPMTAVLAGPLLLPEASTEAEPVMAAAPLPAPEPLPTAPSADALATPPLIEMEAAPVAPLVLTPPPSMEPDVQRPVWPTEERQPQARSLETDLFSEDELAADIGLGPVLRHEIIETPGRRFDFGQLGAYAGMGAVGLVSLGAAVPAAQALFDEGAGPSGETLLVFAALALIGAGCSGISGFNLWRLWREAHARDPVPRDA